jgi:septal ring-binding cell division protein DamX
MPITPGPLEQQMDRKLTARTFVLMLLGAVVLTVMITLVAVAFTNDDVAPAPTTSTTSSTTSSTSTTSTSTSTTSTTTAPATTVDVGTTLSP